MSDWRHLAACLGSDPDWFFSDRYEDHQRALADCARCQVASMCREFAHQERFPSGVYGGESARKRIKNQGYKQRGCGSRAGYQRHMALRKKDPSHQPCAKCIAANREYYRINDRSRRARGMVKKNRSAA